MAIIFWVVVVVLFLLVTGLLCSSTVESDVLAAVLLLGLIILDAVVCYNLAKKLNDDFPKTPIAIVQTSLEEMNGHPREGALVILYSVQYSQLTWSPLGYKTMVSVDENKYLNMEEAEERAKHLNDELKEDTLPKGYTVAKPIMEVK